MAKKENNIDASEDDLERARREGIQEANQAWLIKVVWYIIGVMGAAFYFFLDFVRKGS